jgi:hypothetical protein
MPNNDTVEVFRSSGPGRFTRVVTVSIPEGRVLIHCYGIGPRGAVQPTTAVGFTAAEWGQIAARINDVFVHADLS